MPDELPLDDTALGTQSATLEVGLRVFRQYVLKRFLSRGPLGSAWLVVHEGIGRELAMRFVPEGWLRDERVMSRLRDGVVRLLETTHPGLVGILDFVRDPQAAAIVSKFIDGETMVDAKARQSERSFTVETLRPWLAQVCEALDFAWRQHEAVHGDIYPGNLLLTTGGDMKVLDFGLAKNLFDLDAPSGGPLLAVNVAYASPERIRGGAAGVADDVYAFGATVYELVTSRPPFSRGNVRFQVESVVAPTMAERRQELSISAEPIPPEWEEVVAACLNKVPEDRPKSLREVGERLGLLAPLPALSERPSLPIVLPRPAETVVGLRLPPRTAPGPIPEYPTSMPTVAMEPPTMIGSTLPLPAEVPVPVELPMEPSPEPPMESAPATVDENFDLEATISELPPAPVPAEAESATAAGADDLDATMAGSVRRLEPPSPPSVPRPFVPPPGILPTDDDAAATMAAEEPPPPPAVVESAVSSAPLSPEEPAAPSPLPPAFDVSAAMAAEGSPVPPTLPTATSADPEMAALEQTAPRIPASVKPVQIVPAPMVTEIPPSKEKETLPEMKGLEESVTIPTAVRHAERTEKPESPVAVPPSIPPAGAIPMAAAPPSRAGFRWWWVALPAGLVMVLAAGAMFGRRSKAPVTPLSGPTPVEATPMATLPTETPRPATPHPATPPPATPAPVGRSATAADVAKLAETGLPAEPLLLVGGFRVSTATPALAGRAATAVLRPTDAAISGQIRVIATLSAASAVPAEGAVLALDPSSRYFVREVRRGADGQVNVRIEQR